MRPAAKMEHCSNNRAAAAAAEQLQKGGSPQQLTMAAIRRATDNVILYPVKNSCPNKGQRPKTLFKKIALLLRSVFLCAGLK